ncbi:MAG: cysteine desulfurase family protein [Ilumatobacteraceae bacterium]
MSEYTYLDHAATTPMRAEAVAAMLPYLSGCFANPSGPHRFAREARRAVDEARDDVAAIVGCKPGEVVFTSGGTEADNTAVFSSLDRRSGVAVCSAVEHHAVLHAVESRHGRTVGVLASGHIDIDALDELLGAGPDEVALVSVMTVNNEVGTITDIAAVADVVRRRAPNAVLHTDAVQAACWRDLREISAHVDMLSLSAHKFGGPKGVGVLMVRSGTAFAPLLIGGGQERERRSGTNNVPGIVATAVALRLTDEQRDLENTRITKLRDDMVDEIVGALDDVFETVSRQHKIPGSAHICIAGIENEALLYLLDEAGVCATAASSCASGAMEPSHVLAAMGVSRELAGGALRLTLGHTTTAADVQRGAAAVIAAVRRLRGARPAAGRQVANAGSSGAARETVLG